MSKTIEIWDEVHPNGKVALEDWEVEHFLSWTLSKAAHHGSILQFSVSEIQDMQRFLVTLQKEQN